MCGNLQEQRRTLLPRHLFCASLCAVDGNLTEKCQTLIPRHPFCASLRAEKTHEHFARAILWKFTGAVPYANPATPVSREPAQSKCTRRPRWLVSSSAGLEHGGALLRAGNWSLELRLRCERYPCCLCKRFLGVRYVESFELSVQRGSVEDKPNNYLAEYTQNLLSYAGSFCAQSKTVAAPLRLGFIP